MPGDNINVNVIVSNDREIVEFVRANGQCPFADWVETLDEKAAAKVLTAVERMRQGNLGDHKSVGEGVAERRLDYGPGYRIYYGRDGQKLIVLVGGGTKSRQGADIKNAQEIWAEYKRAKKA